MANPKIERLINIILDIKGADETEKALDAVEKSAKGVTDEAKTGADAAEPRIVRFLERWKLQATALAAAIAGLWTLTKYSGIASGMINMLGSSIGLLMDVLLAPLAEPLGELSGWIVDLADEYDKLPEPIKKATSAILGLTLAFKALKFLGVTSLVKGIAGALLGLAGIDTSAGLIAGLETAMAAGGTAAAAAWVAAIGIGIAAGMAGVAFLVYTGAMDWVEEMGAAFQEKAPGLSDILKMALWPVASLGTIILDIVKLDFGKIPGHLEDIQNEVQNAFLRTGDRIKTITVDTLTWIQEKTGLIPDEFIAIVEQAFDTVIASMASFFDNAESTVLNLVTGIKDKIGGVVDWFKDLLDTDGETLLTRIKSDWDSTLTSIKTAWSSAWDTLRSTAQDAVSGIVTWIRDKIGGVVNWIGSLNPFKNWKLPSFSMPSLPYFQTGGYVHETGLAMLHRGEYVLSSVQAATSNTPGPAKSEGGITIQQVILQGKFEDEHQMYKRFISLLEREKRRVV